jgi:hypothetical protein
MDIWSILRPSEIFYGHLVYLVVIWNIFHHFGMLYQEKSDNLGCQCQVHDLTWNKKGLIKLLYVCVESFATGRWVFIWWCLSLNCHFFPSKIWPGANPTTCEFTTTTAALHIIRLERFLKVEKNCFRNGLGYSWRSIFLQRWRCILKIIGLVPGVAPKLHCPWLSFHQMHGKYACRYALCTYLVLVHVGCENIFEHAIEFEIQYWQLHLHKFGSAGQILNWFKF